MRLSSTVNKIVHFTRNCDFPFFNFWCYINKCTYFITFGVQLDLNLVDWLVTMRTMRQNWRYFTVYFTKTQRHSFLVCHVVKTRNMNIKKIYFIIIILLGSRRVLPHMWICIRRFLFLFRVIFSDFLMNATFYVYVFFIFFICICIIYVILNKPNTFFWKK